MGEWRDERLDFFLHRLTYGFTNPMPTAETGPFMITAKDINYGRILYDQARHTSEAAFENDLTDKSRPEIGDVLVTKDGTLGRMAIVDQDRICINQSVAVLKPRENIRSRFLKYLLEAPQNFQRMLGDADGSTIKHIYITRLAAMSVNVPTIQTQDSIVEILGTLDDKIELNRRTNETLEGMAQAIFKDWFVDFGPVRRKQAGETDPTAILGGLIPPSEKATQTAAVFPDAFGDDGLPKGWGRSEIVAIAKHIAMGPFGSRITKDNFVEDGVPVIRGKNLSDGFVDSDFVFVTEEKAEELSNSMAHEEDIVFTHRGTLGQVGRITPGSKYGRYIVSQSQLLLSVDKKKISPHLVYRFFGSPAGQFVWLSHAGGAGVPAISRPTSSLKKIEIVVPSIEVSEAFEKMSDFFEALSSQKENENQTLAETRDYLLPKLMSGQIRAGDAESMVA